MAQPRKPSNTPNPAPHNAAHPGSGADDPEGVGATASAEGPKPEASEGPGSTSGDVTVGGESALNGEAPETDGPTPDGEADGAQATSPDVAGEAPRVQAPPGDTPLGGDAPGQDPAESDTRVGIGGGGDDAQSPPADMPALGEHGPAGDEGAGEQPRGRGASRQRGLRAALASLPVQEPGPSFWADIDRALVEQPPLQIAARPAIRSINEPPPLSQPNINDYFESTAVLVTEDGDRVAFDGISDDVGEARDDDAGDSEEPEGAEGTRIVVGDHDFDDGPRWDERKSPPPPAMRPLTGANGKNARTMVGVAAAVILVVLIIGSALGRRGGDDPSGAQATTTTVRAKTTTTTATPATTTIPGIPGLDANAQLTKLGLGPIMVRTSLRDLAAKGAKATVDQATFIQSGGTCYDATLPAARDLRLQLRNPDGTETLQDPLDGTLASITITSAPGSLRRTDAGIGLGATEDQVRAAYPGNVEVYTHPIRPGGHIMLVRQGDGLGVVYGTDGHTVFEISVGEVKLIRQRQSCG